MLLLNKKLRKFSCLLAQKGSPAEQEYEIQSYSASKLLQYPFMLRNKLSIII